MNVLNAGTMTGWLIFNLLVFKKFNVSNIAKFLNSTVCVHCTTFAWKLKILGRNQSYSGYVRD